MKKILITGAYGFVGQNLSAYLKQHAGMGLASLDIVADPEHPSYEVCYSWNNLEAINWDDIDTVIHLAGKAHDTKNQSAAAAYFEINTGLTKTIFDLFLASKARKFIFFSSVKAAADKVDGEFLTEDITPAPKGPYGESKILAESYINKVVASQTPQLQGKEVFILRPCMIHGPGNKGNLNLLYNVAGKGVPYPLGAFDNKRSFLSIGNLCYILEALIKREIKGGIYHLADDDALSTNDLITLIAQSVQKPARIWKWNKRLVCLMAGVGDVVKLPLNSERLQKLTENYVVSNRKIKEAIGIQQLPVSATDGLLVTLQSFR